MSISSNIESKIYLLEDFKLPLDLKGCEIVLPKDTPRLREEVRSLLPEARALARPFAAFMVSSTAVLSDSEVKVAGTVFTSELLVEQIKLQDKVFPFLASEGCELKLWSEGVSKGLENAAFAIRFLALSLAHTKVEEFISLKYGTKYIAA
ncbi:MAG: hypothetical protein LBE27_04975, partial [Deltaproteobacteria bacterium]|nr:hypothetical protein [Deltaproteobacteria bacterium]